MEIYILEDDLYHQSRLQEVLKVIARQEGIALDIKLVTGKSDELLESITTFGKKQVYFVDIELRGEEKKGLDTARKIRELDDQATIIFVTTHTEFAAITYFYQVAALGFVDKELPTVDFTRHISSYLKVLLKRLESDQEDIFEVKTQNRHVRVPFQDIYFIETTDIPHKLVLLTHHQRIEFYESMKQLEEREPRFFRAHKAYLINPSKVREIDQLDNRVYFSNGLDCLISRRKIKDLKKRLQE